MATEDRTAAKLWQRYREAPLSEQFKMEWLAFGVVAIAWALLVLVLALTGVLT
jgi:hypothetical protein